MTQPRFRRAQPRFIFIHCLYLAKLNQVLHIGAIVQMVERRNDDLDCANNAGSGPLCATIFLPTVFACLHTSLQAETHNLNDWSVTNQIEYTGFRQDFIFSVFVSYLSRKGPALINISSFWPA